MLTLCFRFRSFSLLFPLSFVCFFSGSSYSAFCFFLSSFFPALSHSHSSGAASPSFDFLALPLPFRLVSRASLSFLSTRLSVRFLSSLSVSLPQPFHRCSLCFRFRAFPFLPLSFVRFRSVLTTQPSDLSFPFFPFSPVGGSLGACLPLPSSLLPCLSFDFGTQPSAISFLRLLSRLTVATSAPQPCGLFPFAYALGSGYLAWAFSYDISHSLPRSLRREL